MDQNENIRNMVPEAENRVTELHDEELETVVGGISVGDRVKVDSRIIRYCPGCNRLATVFTGTVVEKMWYEKNQHYFIEVKSDCCGYVERAADFVCSLDQ